MKALIAYSLLVLIGLAGLGVCLYLAVMNDDIPFLLWIVAILSMLLMLIAVKCYQEERGDK
jgi:hypothetical protein